MAQSPVTSSIIRPRIYVDTSVIGGPYDTEFAAPSRRFWRAVRAGSALVLVSDLTLLELADAPEEVRAELAGVPLSERLDVTRTPEALALAERYIAEGVIGAGSRADAQHIAVAVVERATALASWNFRHIVNLDRIHGYNSVNLRLGYPQLEIRSPREVIPYDEATDQPTP